MERVSEIFRRIFQYTGVSALLVMFCIIYIERSRGRSFKGDRCKKVVDVKDGRIRRFLNGGSPTWSVAAMRNRYYATMILQGYSRSTRIFPPVSVRLSHLLLRNLATASDTVWKRSDVVYWDTSNSFRCFFLPGCRYIVFVSVDITTN